MQRGEMPQLPAEVLQQGGILQPGGMTLQWQEGALPPGGQAAAELGGCGVVQGWGVALWCGVGVQGCVGTLGALGCGAVMFVEQGGGKAALSMANQYCGLAAVAFSCCGLAALGNKVAPK